MFIVNLFTLLSFIINIIYGLLLKCAKKFLDTFIRIYESRKCSTFLFLTKNL